MKEQKNNILQICFSGVPYKAAIFGNIYPFGVTIMSLIPIFGPGFFSPHVGVGMILLLPSFIWIISFLLLYQRGRRPLDGKRVLSSGLYMLIYVFWTYFAGILIQERVESVIAAEFSKGIYWNAYFFPFSLIWS